ncbi:MULTISPECIES: M23 family metallopeptidase [unclassified Novosphingobium]|uniref:M23 family metallopeptidase n=1 Tax=unclassified Novosphingobium TaxID=2644732 RepID=UPI000D3024F7|nr:MULTISPECIES: M23 family metallopeptidase [unclassified Novosphingobium]PTR05688.1 murein DD-endopeptidase MepM/ murein hydrolase activator NlpD [Novosphingobium sp. GV055]PUA94256.1 murein DD-endopeptidase MepM/ murein hydrolase activator NlpD [Novosphingobium sp. GV061]PUB12359.1 murein DD-endopeptidase MepM/ murein hydrolase activator NlpD [Novosphingobium sp. GV079]PUB37273.1 murein DD-endopeptidase MepM/ murein hydrolase activator NlpD [Novosphingobium sp. GV027]
MPKAPQYQQATSGAAPVSARLQAPPPVANGLGDGLQHLGEVIDKISLQHDDTVARQQVLAVQPMLSDALTQFKTQQGGNAVDGLPAARKQLDDIRKQGLDGLKSPRAQQIFSQHFDTLYASALGDMNGHAIQQAAVQRKTVLGAELSTAQDAAAGLVDSPADLRAAVGVVGQKAQAYADFAGLGEAGAQYVKQQQGAVYGMAIDRLVKDDKVDLASALFDAHHDEMTFEQRNSALDALREPMQRRDAANGFLEVTAGLGPSRGAPAAPEGQPGGRVQMPVANGHVTNTFEQHRERGSAGLDIGAPLGAAIHPIAGGTVEAVTQDDRAGRWVKVKHPDGTTSTYAHMGNQSVKPGDVVTPDTVLGTVGMTGHTTGPHVHLRVRGADGADLDPQKVIGGRAGESTLVGSPQAARNWDQASVIAQIDKRSDWSFEKRERVKAYARQRMGQDEQALNDQFQDAADNVHQWIGNYQANHNGDYPPPDALPSTLLGRMKPSDAAELRGSMAKALKAKTDEAERKAQDMTSLGATLRMYNDPQGFMRADLPKEYMGKVSSSDFAQLVTAQARMRQDASKPQAWEPFKDSATALAQYSAFNSLDLKDKDKAAALQTMKAQADAFVAKNARPPSSSEWYDIARRATRSVSTPGMLWGTNETPLYKAAPTSEQRSAVVDTFKRVFKRAPTDDEVLYWYRQQQAGAAIQ